MRDAGCDIRDVQAMLGHAQLSTTETKALVSVKRLKAVYPKRHPGHLPSTAHDLPPRLLLHLLKEQHHRR